MAIFCALLLRLLASGPVTAFLTSSKAESLIFYLETGYLLRPSPEITRMPVESPPPEITVEDPPLIFDQGETVAVLNQSSLDAPDPSALLRQPLSWDLRGEGPTVLIFHSHTTESYEKGEDYVESSPYHTRDGQYNMIAVGDALQAVLEEGGIHVIHDRNLYDTEYADAYDASLSGVNQIMAENPGILLLLDLHRDAAESGGKQIVTTAQVEGKTSAQIMAVCGSDGGGYDHPYWRQNLSIAIKLQAILQRYSPDICRPISLSNSRFNQQYYPGSLLIEVGTAGNTLEEAKIAAQYLGKAILELSRGYATADGAG